MASIRIINSVADSNNPEYAAAVCLRENLKESISESVNGNISIAYGLTLTGQEVRDIDILVVGQLDNYIIPDSYTNNPQYAKKPLKVDSFCIAIELKEHPAHRISFQGTHVLVEYQGQLKDATAQNEKQRYSLLNYISNTCGYKPIVTNVLWLKSLDKKQLRDMTRFNPVGALPAEFSFRELVDKMIYQGISPYYNQDDKCYHLSYSYNGENLLNDIKSIVFSSSTPPAGLTRNKLDLLAQSKAQRSLEQSNIGQELTIFKGRAGTGKTIRLIEAALQLANNDTGKRCLLLTYNHALVSDIRRLLHFMNIPDDIDSYSVQIQTLHSFFMSLMYSIMGTDKRSLFNGNFDDNYRKKIRELYEYISLLMNDKDIKTLKEDYESAIDWDYILIDEAQDWTDDEKNILFKIYGPQRIIVADGVDQFIRNSHKQSWGRNIQGVRVEEQKTGLRQKENVAKFVNAFAEEMGLTWNVKPNKDLRGGEVIIRKNYDTRTHQRLSNYCHSEYSNCENYDILFLVPPQMVSREGNKSFFRNLNTWKENGIHVFDGTNDALREQYSVDLNDCRLYQYESCRGLEGWITICLHFDQLVEFKQKEAKDILLNDMLVLESPEERQRKYAYLWSLMPLTRAIDTLVITIKDTSSDVAKHLFKVAEKYPDFVKIEL